MPNSQYAPTKDSPIVALATLAEVTGDNDQTGDPIVVHFNPVSLQLAVSNELKDTTNNERKQYIAKSSSKLTMDLIFDTTDTGVDVTETTRKIQAFVIPPAPAGKNADPQKPPPLVMFEWGTIRFKGIMENYKETLDFFSANGVPLRSTVNLTLSRQDQVFDKPSSNAPKNGMPGGNDDIFDAPAKSALDTANSLQEPGAARALGAANGQESLRFGSGVQMSVSAGISLKGPVAFAAGGSVGFSAGAGANTGAGGGPGIFAGISAMARLPASEGAFNGLGSKTSESSGSSVKLDPGKLMPQGNTESMAIKSDANFAVGGRLTGSGSSGLRADVGSSKLNFD
jgi:hypothetical protein